MKNLKNTDTDKQNNTPTAYQYYMELDLGEFECLWESDLFQETWLVEGMKFDNFIDYFWEAEITEMIDTGIGCYPRYKDYFSEIEYDNYSKYLCFRDGPGFYYCNEDSCEGCKHSGSKKEINEQYILWQKYVQPIELEYT